MPTPMVSVLMTVYDRAPMVGSAIESVLKQTFTDFELIVVDDGSTDGSVERARAYERLDARVRVVVNEANLGDYPNRNYAASLARGRYLRFHDSDDVMYPYCLATVVWPMEREPRAGIGLSYGSWGWRGGPCPMLLTPQMCYQREFLGEGMFAPGPSNAIFRREVFEELGGFPLTGSHSDFSLWLEAGKRIHFLLLPGDLFWWREHDGQGHQSETSRGEHAVRLSAERWGALHAPDCPLAGEELERAKRNTVHRMARAAWRRFRAGEWRLAWHELQAAGLSFSDWARYLRRMRIDRFAGTPYDPDGGFVIPDMNVFLPAPSEKRATPEGEAVGRGAPSIPERGS